MAQRFTAEDLLAAQTPEVRALTERLRALVREAAPEAREKPQRGWRVLSYGIERGLFAYIAPAGSHVDLGFYDGVDLPDPERLLEGSGKRLRHVKVRGPEDVRPALATLVRAALERRTPRPSPPPGEAPGATSARPGSAPPSPR